MSAKLKDLPLTTEQIAELDRRLDAYEIDKNCGRLASDAVADIRKVVQSDGCQSHKIKAL